MEVIVVLLNFYHYVKKRIVKKFLIMMFTNQDKSKKSLYSKNFEYCLSILYNRNIILLVLKLVLQKFLAYTCKIFTKNCLQFNQNIRGVVVL